MASFRLEVPGRPKSINHIANRYQRAEEVKTWREAGALLAKRIGPMNPPIDIEVTVLYTPRKPLDHEGPAWSIKAVKDSLVDAGVIADDAPHKYVRNMLLRPPEKSDHDALVFLLTEVNDADSPA